MQITVPLRRQQPEPPSDLRPYVGRHREPEPSNPPARTLAELEGATRDLHGPAGVSAAGAAVWRYGQ